MIIGWLSTQFMCFMTNGPFVWLPWQHWIKKKKEFFKWHLLQNHWSRMTNLVQMLLGQGQFKIAKIMVICPLVWLPWQQKAPIDLYMGKWLNCIFLHNQWSDVNHIWQLWLFDNCQCSICVLWPVAILFGCHGNFKFLKRDFFLNDKSFNTTDAVWLIFWIPPSYSEVWTSWE